MSSWAERMHRGAANLSYVMTSCGHHSHVPYHIRRLEKVKFGVPLEEVCKDDIPAPLLWLILKLNKEAPIKKDVFRAPGHQGSTKKLIHFLQAGRLCNIDNYSVHTIASVLKKFLRKIPGGIFGKENELKLFNIIGADEFEDIEINRLITSLPLYTQRLLVLLFGTFRVIATNSQKYNTGMTSEALGVSVAPSFFQSCVSDGRTAKMEDVQRYKVATKVMKLMIDNFSTSNLFGRRNYEFYVRITGRILKVQHEFINPFKFPSSSIHLFMEGERFWLPHECECYGLKFNLETMSAQEESQSTPVLHMPGEIDNTGEVSVSLGMIPENNLLLESCTRLSISLEENGLFKTSSRSSSSSNSGPRMTLEELRIINKYAESTKSLSYLPQVHERQTERMKTRSEWFLNPNFGGTAIAIPRQACSVDSDPQLNKTNHSSVGTTGLSASAESICCSGGTKRSSIRRNSSVKSRHGRANSRRNKENNNSNPSLKKQSSVESQHNIQITIRYIPRV